MPWQSKRDWKPLEQRCCTDIPWLIIFTLFCIGMVSLKLNVRMDTELLLCQGHRTKAG